MVHGVEVTYKGSACQFVGLREGTQPKWGGEDRITGGCTFSDYVLLLRTTAYSAILGIYNSR